MLSAQNKESYSMLLQKIKEFDIPVVKVFEPFNDIKSLISYTRNLTDAEGFIIAFGNGHKLKIKADEYVRIHKTMDRIRFDRNIVALILHEEVDDVIGLLPENEVKKVRDFETKFWKAFRIKESKLLALNGTVFLNYQADPKRVALEFIPLLENKADSSFIFRMINGHNARDLLLDHVKKNINTNTKWEECALFLGIE